MKLRKRISLLVFTLSIFLNSAFAADLILTAPPRETVEEGKKIYEPVAQYLSKLLNRKVTYTHPENWPGYQVNMRHDKYDIIFDGPHFTSWRIAHINFEVLLKLPGELKFVVITQADNKNINTGKDMVGKFFCGISPPNLSSLSFLASFGNPVLQPKVKGVKGGMGKVYQAFTENQCPAAVLRTEFYNKNLDQAEKDKLKIIFTSRSMPNQAVSVSSRLSQEEKSKIRNALISGAGAAALSDIVKRFGPKGTQNFVKTENAEYQGYNAFLEGVIFGW